MISLEEIKKRLLQDGQNPDDFNIIIFDDGYSVTSKSEKEILRQNMQQLEVALLETSTLLAVEQMKNQQNEQAILELTTLLAGGGI